MARRSLALVPALVAALALPAGAVPTYDVAREDHWKPGDLVTVKTTEDRRREVRIVRSAAAGGPAPEVKPQRVRGVVVAVEECLETDLDGHCLRARVWFPTWSFDNGEKDDRSLEGAVAEVRGRGEARGVTLVGARAAPTPAATAWLKRTYGPVRGGDDVRRPWLPRVEVAVGDAWDADLPALLDGLLQGERVDRSRASATARLVSAGKGRAEIACEAALPVVPATGPKWTKGGEYVVKGTLSLALAGRLVESVLATSAVLEGEVASEAATAAVVNRTERRVERKVGGERIDPEAIPPLPSDPAR